MYFRMLIAHDIYCYMLPNEIILNSVALQLVLPYKEPY